MPKQPPRSPLFRKLWLFLKVLAVRIASGTSKQGATCFTFYSEDNFKAGVQCPEECPYRTTCHLERHRSTCIPKERFKLTRGGEDEEHDLCALLIPRGQLTELDNVEASNHTQTIRRCSSCNFNGCSKCRVASNGFTVCKECKLNFNLRDDGTCEWNQDTLHVIFLCGLTVLCLLIFWIVVDVARACCSPATNARAVDAGFKHRRMAKLSASLKNEDKLSRYPLSKSLFHPRTSVGLAGPGFVLFMYWLLFVMAVSLWLMIGALLFAPSEINELEYIDLCRQQVLVKGSDGRDQLEFRNSIVRGRGTDAGQGPYVEWALWNYVGSALLSFIFIVWQTKLWAKMETKVNMQQYCVELSNVPSNITDKQELRRHLNTWLRTLNLGGSDEHQPRTPSTLSNNDNRHSREPIKYVSVVYVVPPDKLHIQNALIECNLRKATEKFDALRNTQSRLGERISALQPSQNFLNIADAELAKETEDAGPFWIQILAFFIFGTPVPILRRCTPVSVSSEYLASTSPEKFCDDAFEFLQSVEGSGYVYVVMDTQALALALAAVGTLSLPSCESPVKVRRAGFGPRAIRWQDHAPVREFAMLLRLAKAVIALLLAFMLWLLFFACFLDFELRLAENSTSIKTVMGLIVGVFVPIGNEIMSTCIDVQTKAFGFRDEDRMRLWRLVLKVLINASANFGEVYIVYIRVYRGSRWKMWEITSIFGKLWTPIGANPYVKEFQEQIRGILFPTGLLVPIITIPLLQNALPLVVGLLRVKRDTRISAKEAEKLLKPCEIDLDSPYSDIIINLLLISYTYWISPGRYHITLWSAVCVWAFLMSLCYRFNVLRWQARGYFGGNQSHIIVSYLLALPLCIFAAALEVQLYPSRKGWHWPCFHLIAHLLLVRQNIRGLEPSIVSQKTYGEMMKDKPRPLANYLNTNPIEVLKSNYMSENSEPGFEEMVFYQSDKWHLVKASILIRNASDSALTASSSTDLDELVSI